MSHLDPSDPPMLIGLAAYLRAATPQKNDIPAALIDLAARIAGCLGTYADEVRVRESWDTWKDSLNLLPGVKGGDDGRS